MPLLHRRRLLPSILVQMLFVVFCLVNLALNVAAGGGHKTYYEILGVDQDGSFRSIKEAYRTLALEHHPDRKNSGSNEEKEEAESIFRDVGEAFEVLGDYRLRTMYDDQLKHIPNAHSLYSDRFNGSYRKFRRYRDEFEQFNSLFQNVEFFKSAAEGMEDLFNKVDDDDEEEEEGGINNNDQGKEEL